jgi:glycerophosphoryl diester phosphodiesterase
VVQQRLPSLLPDPVAFAHRGARAYAQENTLEAFRLGLEMGANGLESDVWLTADGVVVLDHDGVVKRSLGRTTPISQVRRTALPAHVPTLAELVEHCGDQYHLSLDVKDEAAGQPVIDVLRDAAPAMLERVWLCAPTWQSLVPLRGQGVRLVESTALQRMKEGPERRAAELSREGIDAVNLPEREWSGGLAAMFHRFDRAAFGWGIQQQHRLDDALRMGLDGVYSDFPDRMTRAYLDVLGRRPAGSAA